MTDTEQQLRHLARQAPAPTSAWLESLESQARGERQRPRRKGPVFAAGLIAVALAGAVLAVALRRPEAAPTPGDTVPSATTQATTIEAPAASPLVAKLRLTGAAGALRENLVDLRLAAQIVPGSVRTIADTGNGQVAQAFELANGAACLAAYGGLDCALPADNRRILTLSGAPTPGDETAPLLLVVTFDVRSVTIHQKGRTFFVRLHNGVGQLQAPENHLDYELTLTDGTVLRVGLPWEVAPQPPRAPAPSGPGRESSDDILKTAGQPAELPDGFLQKLPPELEKIRPNEPNPGSVRLLAQDFGEAHKAQYAWTNRADVCILNGSVCGTPKRVHMLWLFGGGMPYPDSIIGIVASSVRRAWVQLPDGSRIDATIDRQVVTATIPHERTAPYDAVHLYAELDDGTVIDERPELLG